MVRQEEKMITISVRNLVEFVLRSGDLDNRRTSQADRDAMQAGSRIHRKIQKRMGAGYQAELRNMKRRCFATVAAFSGTMFVLALLLAKPLAALFVGYDRELFDLTAHAFLIYSGSFLFFGFTIYTSSFFTALNNGPVSAAVSFLRTLVFQVAAVFLMPLLMDMEGIWWSVAVAELLALCASLCFLKGFQKQYGY